MITKYGGRYLTKGGSHNLPEGDRHGRRACYAAALGMCCQTASFPPEPEDADHRDPLEPDGVRALELPGKSPEWRDVVIRGDLGLWLRRALIS